MAGIILYLGCNSGRSAIEAGLTAIESRASTHHRYLGGLDNAHVGCVTRHDWELDFHRDDSSGMMTAVFGFALVRGNAWGKRSAVELLEAYLEHGVASLTELDGSFVLAVVDPREEKAFFVNDATGSVPAYWARTDDGVAFAPEGKCLLPMLGLTPKLDERGLLQFMNSGHAYGDHTLLEGVRRVRPAELVEVDLGTRSVRRTRYWSLPPVDEGGPSRLNHAADALFEVVRDAHGAVPILGARDVAVALTGGYDSRVVLSLLASHGEVPLRSFTWGTDDEIPGSDPAVARSLAQTFGSPHTFLNFNASNVPVAAADWVSTSELLSDNSGYCAAGVDFLFDLPMPDLVLTGDHIIGLGTIPRSVDEAVEAVTTVPAGGVSAVFSGVLTDDAEERVREEFRTGMRPILEASPDHHPKAIQDYLYHQIHAPGWLFSPGFFKEPAVAAFRPLMLRPVLEAVSRMPYRFRSDKIVFIRMLRRHLKIAAHRPVASAFSLIDWSYEAIHNSTLRSFLEKQTGEEAVMQSPLGSILDMDRYRRIRTAFFNTAVSPASRSRSFVPIGMEIRRWMAQRPFLGDVAHALNNMAPKGMVGRPTERSHRATFRLLSRVAQATLFHDMLGQRPPWRRGPSPSSVS